MDIMWLISQSHFHVSLKSVAFYVLIENLEGLSTSELNKICGK